MGGDECRVGWYPLNYESMKGRRMRNSTDIQKLVFYIENIIYRIISKSNLFFAEQLKYSKSMNKFTKFVDQESILSEF